MTQDAHTAHTLAGAYALDALSELERRQFEAHLAECDICAQEVRGLQETASRLGVAAAETPPPGLRERVLAEASQVRQAPPRLGRGRSPGPARWAPRLLTVAAAACLVVAVVLGVMVVRTQDRLDRVEAAQRQVNSVLAAPDARAVTSTVQTGGRGTVVVSRQQGKAVVVMSGLAALPSARTYELWVMGQGAPRPAGVMGATAPPVVVGGLGGAAALGITVEPAGGSARPTTNPVFVARLPV